MEVIHNNPFRILGLPVTASTKEITKRVSDLEIFAEMGKTKRYETDYHFLSPIERTVDTVRKASNQIETMEGRFFHSLFWFWEGNSSDELALDVLKDGKVETAVRLWEKQLSNGTDVSKSYSSVKNLSTLYMALARNHNSNGSFSFETFAKGVSWGGKALDTDFLLEYAELLPGSNFIFENDKIADSFVDEILRTIEPKLNSSDDSSLLDFVANFSSFPGKTKSRVVKRFTAKDLKTVDDAISLSERSSEASHEKAHQYGLKLYLTTEEAIESLREVLGAGDYTYQSYADKLASAIDACGTTYYNYHYNKETGIDPGKAALDLARKAKGVAVSFRIKEDIDKGIEIVNEWVEGKSEREKQKKIGVYVDLIVGELDKLPDCDSMTTLEMKQIPKIVSGLVDKVTDSLSKLKTLDYKLHLRISSSIANTSLNLCVVCANNTGILIKVLSALKKVGELEMEPELRERFKENQNILRTNLANRTANTFRPRRRRACYIATMVYGDYDAPQVLVLRRYRDEVLGEVGLGRLFIKFYYRLSPGFVRRFSRFELVHQTARFFLDRIVRRLM